MTDEARWCGVVWLIDMLRPYIIPPNRSLQRVLSSGVPEEYAGK